MTEQQHISGLKGIMQQLNAAIGDAASDGLRVEINVLHVNIIGRMHPTPMIEGCVSRPERV